MANNFCPVPEEFLLGIHLSKFKKRQRNVKKLVTKTGNIKRIFSFLLLLRNERRINELTNARKDEKSPYHTNAADESIVVINSTKNRRVLLRCGVLIHVSTAQTIPNSPMLIPIFSL